MEVPASSSSGVSPAVPSSPAATATSAAVTAAAAAEPAAAAAARPDAYVTLLTSDSFLPGAETLLYSLRKSGTDKALVAMVTPAVSARSRSALRARGASVLEVEPIANPNPREGVHVAGWVNAGYTKLRLWGLVQFGRVLFLDADALVVENVDALFGAARKAAAPFAAAPDVFPPDRFNAGVLLVTPDAAVLRRMLAAVEAKSCPSHDGGDTGFLNSFFPGWFGMPPEARLSFGYNAQRTLHWMTFAKQPGYWNAVAQDLKVLHFSSSPKPWEDTRKKGDLEMLWWQYFIEAKTALPVAAPGAPGGVSSAAASLIGQFLG